MDKISRTCLFGKSSRNYFESLHFEAINIYFGNVLKHAASRNSPKLMHFNSLDEIIETDRGTGKTTKHAFSN